MSNGSIIEVPDIVWFDQLDASPEIPDTAFAALEFVLEPGENAFGTTTVLVASYLLGFPYTELYSNQLPEPINVLAIDANSGNVFLANLDVVYEDETDNSIFINISDEIANQPGPTRNALSVGGYFNVDLPALLGLPSNAAYYHVFLWLDDLVTPIQTIQIPANSARQGFTPGLFEVSGSGIVSVRQSPLSPEAQPGEIRTDLDFSSRSFRVYGTLPPGALETPPTGNAPGSPLLTVIAFCRQTRFFGWHVATDAYVNMKSRSTPHFDFDPFQLIERPDPAANVYVLTVLGNLRNDVLPILTDFQT